MINEWKYIVKRLNIHSAAELLVSCEWEREKGLMVLSWKMIINVAKCLIFLPCTTSFLLFASQLADSLSLASRNGREGEIRQKTFGYQKATRSVMGAFSDFIEMLYIFHSTCPICVSYIALPKICVDIWKGVWHFCLLFLIFINNL